VGAQERGLLQLDAARGVEVVEERRGERGAAHAGAEVPKLPAGIAQAAQGADDGEDGDHGVEVELAEGEARADDGVLLVLA
jgi:hypothetical protein